MTGTILGSHPCYLRVDSLSAPIQVRNILRNCPNIAPGAKVLWSPGGRVLVLPRQESVVWAIRGCFRIRQHPMQELGHWQLIDPERLTKRLAECYNICANLNPADVLLHEKRRAALAWKAANGVRPKDRTVVSHDRPGRNAVKKCLPLTGTTRLLDLVTRLSLARFMSYLGLLRTRTLLQTPVVPGRSWPPRSRG